MNEELVHRRLVRPTDLNSANRLFGGQMLSWIDETAATYAMNQLSNTSVVTAKISEVNFLKPGKQGDMLEFYASTVKMGKTTLTVHMRVVAKSFMPPEERDVTNCNLVFVSVDSNGKPTPHGKDNK